MYVHIYVCRYVHMNTLHQQQELYFLWRRIAAALTTMTEIDCITPAETLIPNLCSQLHCFDCGEGMLSTCTYKYRMKFAKAQTDNVAGITKELKTIFE